MLITLCGLCPMLCILIICLAGPDIGLVSAAVLIVMFCIATFFMFPRKVSEYSFVIGFFFLITQAHTYCFVWHFQFFWIFVSIIINQLSMVKITSALGYYYTASERCVPNGTWWTLIVRLNKSAWVILTLSLSSFDIRTTLWLYLLHYIRRNSGINHRSFFCRSLPETVCKMEIQISNLRDNLHQRCHRHGRHYCH